MASLLETLRYERKYFTLDYSAEDLEQFVLANPAVFRSQYYPRRVCSIYFDTPNLDYYALNVIGSADRKKVRVRWYEHDDKLSDLQLEVKLKRGELSRKEVRPLQGKISDYDLQELSSKVRQVLKPVLAESDLLVPVVTNSYLRRYFYSNDAAVRATVDSELEFRPAEVWERGGRPHYLPATILECKYAVDQDKVISEVAQGFPLKATKSSKYLMGVESI